MSPELSKTRNKMFPFVLMEGGGGTLLRKRTALDLIAALAENADRTPEDIKDYLADGGKIQFTWAEESEPNSSPIKS